MRVRTRQFQMKLSDGKFRSETQHTKDAKRQVEYCRKGSTTEANYQSFSVTSSPGTCNTNVGLSCHPHAHVSSQPRANGAKAKTQRCHRTQFEISQPSHAFGMFIIHRTKLIGNDDQKGQRQGKSGNGLFLRQIQYVCVSQVYARLASKIPPVQSNNVPCIGLSKILQLLLE